MKLSLLKNGSQCYNHAMFDEVSHLSVYRADATAFSGKAKAQLEALQAHIPPALQGIFFITDSTDAGLCVSIHPDAALSAYQHIAHHLGQKPSPVASMRHQDDKNISLSAQSLDDFITALQMRGLQLPKDVTKSFQSRFSGKSEHHYYALASAHEEVAHSSDIESLQKAIPKELQGLFCVEVTDHAPTQLIIDPHLAIDPLKTLGLFRHYDAEWNHAFCKASVQLGAVSRNGELAKLLAPEAHRTR